MEAMAQFVLLMPAKAGSVSILLMLAQAGVKSSGLTYRLCRVRLCVSSVFVHLRFRTPLSASDCLCSIRLYPIILTVSLSMCEFRTLELTCSCSSARLEDCALDDTGCWASETYPGRRYLWLSDHGRIRLTFMNGVADWMKCSLNRHMAGLASL